MRELEKLSVDYMGYTNPVDKDEVLLEMLGLKLAVKIAEQKIALLEQSLHLAFMKEKDLLEKNTKDKDE